MISQMVCLRNNGKLRKAELVEDGRFNLCANEPWASLMPKLVIEQWLLEKVSKNKVATTQLESDLDSSSSTESDYSSNEEPEKLEEHYSSPEKRLTKIRNKFKGKSILSSSKGSFKESNKTLSSSELSSSIAAKLKITKCGKGKSSSSELSQPEDKNLESKAKADSYTTEPLSNISSNIPVSSHVKPQDSRNKKTNTPFRREKAEEIEVDPRLKDNSFLAKVCLS
ncbi:hypothetical protein BY996DRAFT_8497369 [Phakopsora pachyrhizi]|nr:hypothetical protein BY996DRAFT_8497369 [Phakopsora pachyrhizi]